MLLVLAWAAFAIYGTIHVVLLTGLLRLRRGGSQRQPSVSVVVAAHNEETHLPKCLQALLTQTYPKDCMEIIVVNDRSTDCTPDILRSFAEQSDALVWLDVEATPSGTSPKKYALQQGIARATGEWILTTDADCVPPPPWIHHMSRHFVPSVGLVAGPAPLEPGRTLLSRIVALDSLATALVSAGTLGHNRAVTCAGRNLAYRKQTWQDSGGFEGILHSLSGDDDLFLQHVWRRTPWQLTFCLNAQAAVPSTAPETMRQFVRQRRRHISAGKFYARHVQVGYALFHLANFFLVAFWVYAALAETHLLWATCFLGMKLAIDFTGLALIVTRLRHAALLIYFPLWELFFLFTQLCVAPLAFVGKLKWR